MFSGMQKLQRRPFVRPAPFVRPSPFAGLTHRAVAVPPQPAPPVQKPTEGLLDDLIKLAIEIGWATYKAEWERVSPESRRAWDIGTKLATSPSVPPLGQKVGLAVCAASFLAGLDEVDKASGD